MIQHGHVADLLQDLLARHIRPNHNHMYETNSSAISPLGACPKARTCATQQPSISPSQAAQRLEHVLLARSLGGPLCLPDLLAHSSLAGQLAGRRPKVHGMTCVARCQKVGGHGLPQFVRRRRARKPRTDCSRGFT